MHPSAVIPRTVDDLEQCPGPDAGVETNDAAPGLRPRGQSKKAVNQQRVDAASPNSAARQIASADLRILQLMQLHYIKTGYRTHFDWNTIVDKFNSEVEEHNRHCTKVQEQWAPLVKALMPHRARTLLKRGLYGGLTIALDVKATMAAKQAEALLAKNDATAARAAKAQRNAAVPAVAVANAVPEVVVDPLVVELVAALKPIIEQPATKKAKPVPKGKAGARKTGRSDSSSDSDPSSDDTSSESSEEAPPKKKRRLPPPTTAKQTIEALGFVECDK